jgi:primosomal protein N''
VVEHLLSKHKALSSNPSTTKTKQATPHPEKKNKTLSNLFFQVVEPFYMPHNE